MLLFIQRASHFESHHFLRSLILNHLLNITCFSLLILCIFYYLLMLFILSVLLLHLINYFFGMFFIVTRQHRIHINLETKSLWTMLLRHRIRYEVSTVIATPICLSFLIYNPNYFRCTLVISASIIPINYINLLAFLLLC